MGVLMPRDVGTGRVGARRRTVLLGAAATAGGIALGRGTRSASATGAVAAGGRYLTSVCSNYPCAVDNGHGEAAFGVGPGGLAYHRWQNSTGGAWSSWSPIGSQVLASRPVPVVATSGAMALFGRAASGDLVHTWQGAAGGSWAPWINFGARVASEPAVVMVPSGAVALFVRGADGNLLHRWQSSEGGAWSGWISFESGTVGRPAAIVGLNGAVALFSRRASDGQLVHKWQTASGGSWSPGWTPLNLTLAADPVAVMNPYGGVAVFGVSTNGLLGHVWQVAGGGAWAGPFLFGSYQVFGRPAVVVGPTGGMDLVAMGGFPPGLIHARQTSFGQPWSPWTGVALGTFSEPSAVTTPFGVLAVYARTQDRRMFHIWQTAPAGSWSMPVVWDGELNDG